MTWKEFTMEEQAPSEYPLDIVPLWMRISLVALCLLFVLLGISRHGLASWDWVIFVVPLGIFFFPVGVTKPLGRNLRWPMRVVFVLWVIACSALCVHFWGWVPGLALAGIGLLSPSREKFVSWKTYLHKLQNVVVALLTLILIVSFARSTGAWVPTVCVVATFLLLEGYTRGYTLARRSLRDNLRRRSFAAIVAIAIFAAVWAWLHPSFGNVAGLVMVIVLVSSDIYLHTEEKPSLHVSQSRS
jgi:hypothetical protein